MERIKVSAIHKHIIAGPKRLPANTLTLIVPGSTIGGIATFPESWEDSAAALPLAVPCPI
ncbi:MAG: hypothetical protein NPIRA02_20050 [Nitrospirales bacterium]|nr:MAG: hypothetical protein NPIRA02_20050 [Nitrospirales bacterium]